jgi:hypothetical protein
MIVEIITRRASGQILHVDDDKQFGKNSDRKQTVCFTVKTSGNISYLYCPCFLRVFVSTFTFYIKL